MTHRAARSRVSARRRFHLRAHHPELLDVHNLTYYRCQVSVRPQAEVLGQDIVWQCPICDGGILASDLGDYGKSVLDRVRAEHRLSQHPLVTGRQFVRLQSLKYSSRPELVRRRRALALNRILAATLRDVQHQQGHDLVHLMWPKPLRLQHRSGRLRGSLWRIWGCQRCRRVARWQGFRTAPSCTTPLSLRELAARRRRLQSLARCEATATPAQLQADGIDPCDFQRALAAARNFLAVPEEKRVFAA